MHWREAVLLPSSRVSLSKTITLNTSFEIGLGSEGVKRCLEDDGCVNKK